MSLLVESEQDVGKIITHTPITHYKNYARKVSLHIGQSISGSFE